MVNGNGGVWNLEEDETTKCEATGSVRAVFQLEMAIYHLPILIWLVVSNIFYFPQYMG